VEDILDQDILLHANDAIREEHDLFSAIFRTLVAMLVNFIVFKANLLERHFPAYNNAPARSA
jgi:hypothetical protein